MEAHDETVAVDDGETQDPTSDLPDGTNAGESGLPNEERSLSPTTASAPAPDAEVGERPEDPASGGTVNPAVERELPAEDQAPVASERDRVIVGDSGMYEQQPFNEAGNPDQPHRTSAPPASLQSGVPLPEDRAAGVEPGPQGPRLPESQRQ